MRWGIVLLLLAPLAQADQTATIRWTVPTTTVDGTPLKGPYALTTFRVVVDGKATRLPASVFRHQVEVASGHTISVQIQACHASRCSAPSPTIRFTAAGDPPTLNQGPERGPERGPEPAPEYGIVGTSHPAAGQLVWSGIGQRVKTVNYGKVVKVKDAMAVTVNIRAEGARQGTLVSLFPFKIDLVNGRVRAQWRNSRREEHIELVNPRSISARGTLTVSFTCDRQNHRWSLTVNGSQVSIAGPRRCLGDAWGKLEVGGAGGEAKIDVVRH